jgi:hypothetical protein
MANGCQQCSNSNSVGFPPTPATLSNGGREAFTIVYLSLLDLFSQVLTAQQVKVNFREISVSPSLGSTHAHGTDARARAAIEACHRRPAPPDA